MATVSVVQFMSPHKNVLQQSNNNVPVAEDRREAGKTGERNIIILRRKRKASPETENHVQIALSDATRLRSIRLVGGDKSSQKTVIKKREESSDEERRAPKVRPIVPNYVTNSDGGAYRKPRQIATSQSVKTPKPQTVSIARRNARERNRVKQVNEGFSTLRNHIPDHIAGEYNEEKGRKNSKKLSKVETLRMAVDYIRHLEVLLDFKSDDAEWLVKPENLSWNTSNSSGGYPSPIESPATPCDTYPFTDRQFFDSAFDLELQTVRGSPELTPSKLLALSPSPKCFEIFEKIKKETPDDSDVDIDEPDVEIDLSRKTGSDLVVAERDGDNNSPLPSINETFPTRKLSAFYDTCHYIPYQLINLSTKE